jgi:hypothetical protein
MAEYVTKLFDGSDKKWLQTELETKMLQLAQTTEVATCNEWKTWVQQAKTTVERQYLALVALVLMPSVRKAAGISDEHIQFAKQQLDGFVRGSPGYATDMATFMFVIRCHYIHL